MRSRCCEVRSHFTEVRADLTEVRADLTDVPLHFTEPLAYSDEAHHRRFVVRGSHSDFFKFLCVLRGAHSEFFEHCSEFLERRSEFLEHRGAVRVPLCKNMWKQSFTPGRFIEANRLGTDLSVRFTELRRALHGRQLAPHQRPQTPRRRPCALSRRSRPFSDVGRHITEETRLTADENLRHTVFLPLITARLCRFTDSLRRVIARSTAFTRRAWSNTPLAPQVVHMTGAPLNATSSNFPLHRPHFTKPTAI